MSLLKAPPTYYIVDNHHNQNQKIITNTSYGNVKNSRRKETRIRAPKANRSTLTKSIEQWAKAVIFNDKAQIIAHKNCNAKPDELKAYFKAYESRDDTIGQGRVICNEL